MHSVMQSIIAMLVFNGSIHLIFEFPRYHFVLQVIFLLGLIGLTFLGLLAVHNQFRAGWLMLAFVYAAILADLLLTYFLRRAFDDQLLLLFTGAALGMVYSVASMPLGRSPARDATVPKLETYSNELKGKKRKSRKRRR